MKTSQCYQDCGKAYLSAAAAARKEAKAEIDRKKRCRDAGWKSYFKPECYDRYLHLVTKWDELTKSAKSNYIAYISVHIDKLDQTIVPNAFASDPKRRALEKLGITPEDVWDIVAHLKRRFRDEFSETQEDTFFDAVEQPGGPQLISSSIRRFRLIGPTYTRKSWGNKLGAWIAILFGLILISGVASAEMLNTPQTVHGGSHGSGGGLVQWKGGDPSGVATAAGVAVAPTDRGTTTASQHYSQVANALQHEQHAVDDLQSTMATRAAQIKAADELRATELTKRLERRHGGKSTVVMDNLGVVTETWPDGTVWVSDQGVVDPKTLSLQERSGGMTTVEEEEDGKIVKKRYYGRGNPRLTDEELSARGLERRNIPSSEVHEDDGGVHDKLEQARQAREQTKAASAKGDAALEEELTESLKKRHGDSEVTVDETGVITEKWGDGTVWVSDRGGAGGMTYPPPRVENGELTRGETHYGRYMEEHEFSGARYDGISGFVRDKAIAAANKYEEDACVIC